MFLSQSYHHDIGSEGHMDKHHEFILTLRLEDALRNGCAHITWEELKLWYHKRRIAAATRRDLIERWEELAVGTNAGRLMKINGRGGVFIFAQNHAKPFREQ